MKHFIAVTVLCLNFVFNGLTQITLQSSDMPSTGDTVRMSFAVENQTFDFAATGENFNWDFSSLQAVSQRLDTFKSVTETPTVFWLSFLSSANLAIRLGSAELLPGLVLDDAYQFSHKSASAFKEMGYGIILSEIPIPLKFTNPDVIYTFPYTAGQSHTSDANLDYTLPGLGFLSIERNRQTTADGWGNLTTPFGSFEVLRLKSVVYEKDSVFIDTAAQGMIFERNYTEYKWLAKNMKVPVLQCVDDQLLGLTVLYQDSLRDLTVSVPKIEKLTKVKVMPNPVSHSAKLYLTGFVQGEVFMKLMNSLGLTVKEAGVNVINTDFAVDLPFHNSDIPPGVYVLEIIQNGYKVSSKIIFSNSCH